LTLSCPDPTDLIGGVAWTVGAAVEDVNGASDAGAVPLEILNRPPAFAMEGGSAIPAHATVAHAYGPCAQAGGQCFRTADEPGIVALDPDGDPLEASAAPGIEAGRSHSRGTASVGGDGVARFAFETDEAYPLEFRAIDGSTGFSVEGAAVDPFGAAASLSLPVRVSNAPPVLEVPAPVVSAGHAYDRSSDRYRVPAIVVARIRDPDGDPVLGGGVGDALCTVFGGEGTVEVGCGLPYASGGTVPPPLGSLVGDHPLDAVAQDAWDPTWAAMTLRVGNQPPVPDAPYTFSTSSAACLCVCSVENDKGVCLGRDWVSGFVEVPVRFAEPDDDPVLSGGAVCLPGSCTVRRGEGTHQIVLDDGVAAATAQFTVSVDCTPSGTCGP
jgi:hypothetical protein